MELIGERAVLFTDIEGSTALFKQVGELYGDLLDTHHRILREAIRSSGGTEVISEGDSFVAIFDEVETAVNASISAQRRLRRERWPADGEVKVRMGIHAGEVARSESGYIGMAFHETARISAAAHGGQVLVSESVASALESAPGAGASIGLRNLGRFELKDIGSVALVQLEHPDLEQSFPPPRTSGLGNNNLPARLDSLIGRRREIDAVARLVGDHRLVTLIGAGGVGKTRVAVAVATELIPEFPDGVWFVELDEVEPDGDISGALGAAIGGAGPGTSIDELVQRCRNDHSLIVLDNCEHVLSHVVDAVSRLTSQCPRLRVLATSQEPLGLAGELAWRVPSMPSDEAIRLFRTRAAAVRPDLPTGQDDDALIERICGQLDGIPLAIELAAARCRTMPLIEVNERLADRFRLLRAGGAGNIARHQTLLATVDWSFGLLGEREQNTAARISVFRGGADLDAIEAVCVDPDAPLDELLDLIDVLNAKSIVQVEFGVHHSRVQLPETIRQYAARRLAESGEADSIAERHARYFADFASRAERGWRTVDSSAWVRRCSAEAENLAAASDWLELHDPEAAATMLCDLRIWLTAEDGPSFLKKVARLSERADLPRAAASDIAALRALLGEGYGREGADVAAASALRALENLDAVTDPYRRLRVMAHVAIGLRAHDLARAIDIAATALGEARALGDPDAMAAAMFDLILLRPEDDPATRALRRELIDAIGAREPGAWGVGLFVDEALDAHHHGRHTEAIRLLERVERKADLDGTGAPDAETVAFTVWSSLIRAEQGDHAAALLLTEHTLGRLDADSVHLRKVVHSTRGLALMLAGRPADARRSFETAIDRADGWRYLVHAIAVVGLAELDTDDGAGYLEIRQRLAVIVDDHTRQGWLRARAHDVLARAALRDGQVDEARAHVLAADEVLRTGAYVVPPALAIAYLSLRAAVGVEVDSSETTG